MILHDKILSTLAKAFSRATLVVQSYDAYTTGTSRAIHMNMAINDAVCNTSCQERKS